MSVIFSRALHMASKLPCYSLRSFSRLNFSSIASLQNLSPPFLVSRPCQSFHPIPYLSKIRTLGGPCASVRGFRKSRRRLAAKKQLAKEKQLELDVKICIEEEMPDDPEVLVHGLLHLLGFDHEKSDEAEEEMEKEEELVLKSLGWKGKGLIHSAYDALTDESPQKEKSAGTLLNSKSQVTLKTAEALREAISRGVRVVIATGKTRPAVISALKMVDLAGKDGVISESSPGIFLQVKYKHMMPAAALEYVRSRRPRVLLAPAQWQAVQDYCKYWMGSAAKQIELGKSTSVSTFMTSADKVLFSSSSSTLTAFADEVLITEADLEGYSTCEVRNDSSRELSIPCRAVRGRAMLTRLSCLFTSLKASGGSSSITGRLLEIRAC